jgi:hypothetical protein
VHSTFNAGLKTRAEIVIAAGFSGLGADCLEETLRPEAAVNFADTNRTGARFLIKGDEAVGHHGAVGCPRGMGIGEPIGPSCHLGAESLRFISKTKKPVGKIYCVSSTWSRGARKAGANELDVVLSHTDGDSGGKIRVGFEGAIRGIEDGGVTKSGMFVL